MNISNYFIAYHFGKCIQIYSRTAKKFCSICSLIGQSHQISKLQHFDVNVLIISNIFSILSLVVIHATVSN